VSLAERETRAAAVITLEFALGNMARYREWLLGQLHRDELAALRAERVVLCSQCDWACERKPEKQTAWCTRVRILVNTMTPVVCPYFFPAR
jgi:hypothetical protein